MPLSSEAIAQERAFVETFSSKMEGAGAEADGSADPEAGAADVADPETAEVDDDKVDNDAGAEDAKDNESEADKAAEDAEDEKDGEKVDDETKGADETDDAADTEGDATAEAEEKKVRAETQELLQRHGLKATVQDVAPALEAALKEAGLKGQPLKAAIAAANAVATQIIERKLGGVDRAFTRGMTELRDYRKQERSFLAERAFFDKNPARALADRIRKVENADERAELINSVQSFIDTFEDKDKSKLFDIETKQEMEDARKEIDRQYSEIEKRGETADRITQYAFSAARRLGLPWENLENAVVVALNAKPDDARELSEAELDQVIEGQLRIERRHRATVIREDKKSQIRARTKDRRTTTPASRIGGSTAPVGRQAPKMPKNDAEFAEHMLQKLSGSR